MRFEIWSEDWAYCSLLKSFVLQNRYPVVQYKPISPALARVLSKRTLESPSLTFLVTRVKMKRGNHVDYHSQWLKECWYPNDRSRFTLTGSATTKHKRSTYGMGIYPYQTSFRVSFECTWYSSHSLSVIPSYMLSRYPSRSEQWNLNLTREWSPPNVTVNWPLLAWAYTRLATLSVTWLSPSRMSHGLPNRIRDGENFHLTLETRRGFRKIPISRSGSPLPVIETRESAPSKSTFQPSFYNLEMSWRGQDMNEGKKLMSRGDYHYFDIIDDSGLNQFERSSLS